MPGMKPDTKSSEHRIGRLERRMRQLEAIVGSPGRLGGMPLQVAVIPQRAKARQEPFSYRMKSQIDVGLSAQM